MLSAFFLLAGANHFLHPAPYLAMMPPSLPWPRELVYLSGTAEMIGGMGVLFRTTRAYAGAGLITLLVAVFPANLNVALHGWPGVSLPSWSLWLRLTFQIAFIWWVCWICLSKKSGRTLPASK